MENKVMRFCSLASGSSGNSIFVQGEESKILVDAGLSGKAIEERLAEIKVDPKELDALFVSHEHIDHIKGIGVLSRRYNLPVYATEKTWAQLGSLGKIAEENQCYISSSKGCQLADLKVDYFSTSHDAVDPIGFTFTSKQYKIGLATDTGLISSEIRKNLLDCDLLFLEANYDQKMLEYGSYPVHLKRRIASPQGHLSNSAAGESLTQLISGKTKKVFLAHLSEENNLPKLAYHTIKEILEDINLEVKKDLDLEVAPRYGVSSFIDLNNY